MTHRLTAGLAALVLAAVLAPAAAATGFQTVPATVVAQLASDDVPLEEEGVLRAGPTDVASAGPTVYRGLLRFELPDDLDVGGMYGATLVLPYTGCYMGDAPTTTVYPVLSPWGVAWEDQPEVGEPLGSDTGSCPTGALRLDVTDLVLAWAGGGTPNYGIELRGDEGLDEARTYYDAGADEETTRLDRAFQLSEEGPRLEIAGPADPWEPPPADPEEEEELIEDSGEIDLSLAADGHDYEFDRVGSGWAMREVASSSSTRVNLPGFKRLSTSCFPFVTSFAETKFCYSKFEPIAGDGDPHSKYRLFWAQSWAKPKNNHKLELVHAGFIGRHESSWHMTSVEFSPPSPTKTNDNCKTVHLEVSFRHGPWSITPSRNFSICGHHTWFGMTNVGAARAWEAAWEWQGKETDSRGYFLVEGGALYQIPQARPGSVKARLVLGGRKCSRIPLYC